MKRSLTFTREEYQSRLQRVEAALEQAGFDALIAYSVAHQPGPVAYLGGYEPCLGLHDVAFFLVLPGAQPRSALLTNAFWDNPQTTTWIEEVLITSDFGVKLAECLPDSVRRIGIAGYRFFPAPVYRALQAAFPEACVEDATQLLLDVAKVKSPEEIEVLRRCVDMTDVGGQAFLASVQEGISDREVKAEVERAIMLAGADGLWFNTSVCSGPQVAFGIGFGDNRILERGDQVQVICGALYQSYRGDLSRVTAVGVPARASYAIMEATAAMYEAMLRTVRPGVPIAEVAGAAINFAKARGLESYLYRSPHTGVGNVGHGIGCFYDEFPVHPGEKGILEANMVINFEAMLGQSGMGGAKIGDAVLVTDRGAERLSHLELRTWSSQESPL
jgi:Xaa-Pro aminopeptidase